MRVRRASVAGAKATLRQIAVLKLPSPGRDAPRPVSQPTIPPPKTALAVP